MNRAIMPDTKTRKGYLIPGGWTAEIPEWSADDEYIARLRGYLLPVFQHDVRKAEKEARSRVEEFGRSEWLRRMAEFVARCADDYASRWPLKVNPDKTLKGFDPEKLHHLYVPFDPLPGRRGKPRLRKVLSDMAAA